MKPQSLPMVYLVDDEEVVRDALAWLLRSRRLLSEGFGSAEAFESMLDGVPTAVAAVKQGAYDFVEKPFSDNALVDRVEHALAQSAEAIAARDAKSALGHRVGDLTEREREVMQLVVQGLPNKLIADQLNISVRTVEVHRARVFEKMDVKKDISTPVA